MKEDEGSKNWSNTKEAVCAPKNSEERGGEAVAEENED